MATVMKTPGVYIVEKPAFPNSVVEVATAVPAFIGYTQNASYKGQDLKNKPWKIASMAEYLTYFGGPPTITFNVKSAAQTQGQVKAFSVKDKDYFVAPAQGSSLYLMYASMLFFFQNGGGSCYIVSVGSYSDALSADTLMAGIDLLAKEQEPTMVVIPDAVRLDNIDHFNTVQAHAVAHCGTVRSRFAILDVYEGWKELSDGPVVNFRNKIPPNNLDFAAAYYPWLDTTIIGDELVAPVSPGAGALVAATIDSGDLTALLTDEGAVDPKALTDLKDTPGLLNKTLTMKSAAVAQTVAEIERQLNRLPPSPAMAGVYSAVDGSAGVWKAPANVGLNSVVAPTVTISDQQQDDLNVDAFGKSVNAIRTFIGQGVLVWGARTLDGNSLDWRYVGVRRTMIMLEQSIKLATQAYVFENNVSTTWVTIKSMIKNFLNSIWKRGGLQGAVPDDAFQVFCGLGETMTPDDILEGILRVTVLVAMIRPAEFIEITFQQQMPKS